MSCNCCDTMQLDELKKLQKVVKWLLQKEQPKLEHTKECNYNSPKKEIKCQKHQKQGKRKPCLMCDEETKAEHRWLHACNCIVGCIEEILNS